MNDITSDLIDRLGNGLFSKLYQSKKNSKSWVKAYYEREIKE